MEYELVLTLQRIEWKLDNLLQTVQKEETKPLPTEEELDKEAEKIINDKTEYSNIKRKEGIGEE